MYMYMNMCTISHKNMYVGTFLSKEKMDEMIYEHIMSSSHEQEVWRSSR